MAAEQIAGSNLLKVLYPDDVSTPQYEASKAFGLMKKDTKFASDGTKYVVVSIAPGAGGSANIANAIANQSATQQVRFSLGRKKLYEVGSVDGEAMAVAKNGGGDNSKGAILDIVKHAMKRARDAFSRTFGRAVWGSGGGARGRISGVTTGTTITLTNRADGVGFFKGMKLQAQDNDGYTTVTSPRVGTATITSLTRKNSSGNCTLTASAAWDTLIGGIAANDYLFRDGDYAQYPNGIPGWAPIADPGGGDSFLSVNRSTAGDLNYLSGWRVSGSGQPKQQTLIDGAAEAAMNGIRLRTVFMNPLDMRDAFKEQSSYKTIEVKTDRPNVGYKGIELMASVGAMTVLEEPDLPQGYFWMINPEDDWTCRSAGDCPMLLDFDGLKSFLRNPNGDDYQFRLGCYLNFENAEPVNAVAGTF
ncbi:MAG TPA: hypothetical protein VJN18_35830 [Polyangiaceae bacterium]|nr:hypothetical protein [Polyangiaceae bacterium]